MTSIHLLLLQLVLQLFVIWKFPHHFFDVNGFHDFEKFDVHHLASDYEHALLALEIIVVLGLKVGKFVSAPEALKTLAV